jgi:PAS domain-containing protein
MAIAAESARSQLRLILDAVGDGVLVVDGRQSIVLHSDSIANLTGANGEASGWRCVSRCQGRSRRELRHDAAGPLDGGSGPHLPGCGTAHGDREWSPARCDCHSPGLRW